MSLDSRRNPDERARYSDVDDRGRTGIASEQATVPAGD
jgi:hypothetical protein